MARSTPFTTLQIIADILSFNTPQQILSEQLQNTKINWDAVVVISSNHLMLPALYCRLKSKGLLPYIPTDLQNYLEEITDINRARNEKLLKETYIISDILSKENIDHVFIKGIALIASSTYEDMGERMIGDIDILVADNHIEHAFDLINKLGYTKTITYNYDNKNLRHLPRQISEHNFGAIELHREILRFKFKHLINPVEVLKNKRIINGISVPSIDDSIKISILALQVNDNAHYLGNMHLKSIFDCINLKLPQNKKLLHILSKEKHANSFLHISNLFFKELYARRPFYTSKFLRGYFRFKLQRPKLGYRINHILKTYNTYTASLLRFLTNKSYRSYVLKLFLVREN
ncbi:putative nucleotidyltransferase-like protein [Gelidibacter sediminis]|uniref:Putative nucleotidyltransferase-like protein n=1 Tax=Gelidibacter sediminis TaxID=1608710 RepID=A0A4R7Q5S0_9FLAO|nr:nucleotidyltransferase family protein [Gelidibacter sediminis]TDU42913.1 putative nucleotidyltransferase-like protein [Gelidibacter sediminis]